MQEVQWQEGVSDRLVTLALCAVLAVLTVAGMWAANGGPPWR